MFFSRRCSNVLFSTHHSSHLDAALTAVVLGLATGGTSTALDVILGLGVDQLTHAIGHGVEHLGKELEHGVDHLAHEISHGAQHLAHEIGHGVDHLAHEIGHGVDHLGHEIGHGVQHVGHEIEHGVHHIGHEIHRKYQLVSYICRFSLNYQYRAMKNSQINLIRSFTSGEIKQVCVTLNA